MATKKTQNEVNVAAVKASKPSVKRWLRIEASGYQTLVLGRSEKGVFTLFKTGKEGKASPIPRQAADAILRHLLAEFEVK